MADAIDELLQLLFPGGVGIAEGGLLRRIADREAGMLAAFDDPLVAVAAGGRGHAVDNHVTVLHKDFQSKAVLPLSERAVQHSDAPIFIAQQGEGIVFQREIPESGSAHALDLIKLAIEMTEEIEHVNALVEQDAAPGQRRAVTPFAGLAGAFRLAVDPAHPQNFTILTAINDLLRLHDAVVIAVIESHLQHQAGITFFRRHDALDIRHIAARGFFAEHMLAGIQGGDHHLGNKTVGRADKHRIDPGLDHRPVIREDFHIVKPFFRRIGIGAGNQHRVVMLPHRCRANAAHLPQPDNTDFQWFIHLSEILFTQESFNYNI